jgi:hypothetical protein
MHAISSRGSNGVVLDPAVRPTEGLQVTGQRSETAVVKDGRVRRTLPEPAFEVPHDRGLLPRFACCPNSSRRSTENQRREQLANQTARRRHAQRQKSLGSDIPAGIAPLFLDKGPRAEEHNELNAACGAPGRLSSVSPPNPAFTRGKASREVEHGEGFLPHNRGQQDR